MKPLLNTLYVTLQGAYISRQGRSLLVKLKKERKLCVPIHTLSGVVCMGRVSVSPRLIELCAHSGVPIAFLTEHGRFLARLTGGSLGNVLLRRAQFRLADDSNVQAEISRSFVVGKIENSRQVLLRAARDR